MIVLSAALTLLAAYGLGRIWFRKTEAPPEIMLAVGAALLSLATFFLLALGLAGRSAFTALAAAGISGLFLVRGRAWRPELALSRPLWILLPFGVLYLVHALAPEIEPDAVGYHLSNVAEYLRLGHFPESVDFYEIMPHGVEMLFAVAASWGGYSAAKLVHFALFAATVPLILSLGRRLGLEQPVPALAAVFYAVTPVVGVTGTCAYVDAALTFYAFATVDLLAAWLEQRKTLLLASAGIAAGFCYGVKITGLAVAACAVAWLLWRRQWKAAAVFGGAASALIAPWMARAYLMTGNPVAPLLNRFFPNPYFHVLSEREWAAMLQKYGGETWLDKILDLTLRGEASLGLLGPCWLLAPLALLALRRPAGRILLALSALLAVPWLFNTAARFLIPVLPALALALFMVLPRRISWVAVVGHAVLSWPAATALYASPYVWRLKGFPLAAALRIEPEPEYLRRTLFEYSMAETIQRLTPPQARILDLHGTAPAYAGRHMRLFYQSAATEACVMALRTAFYQHLAPLHDLGANWPETPLQALRLRQEAAGAPNWSVIELSFYRGGYRLQPSARWTLNAWPNLEEAPLALDGNFTTYWASWETVKPGMFIEVRFDRPQWLTGAAATGFRIEQQSRVAFYGQGLDGAWRLLSDQPAAAIRRDANLRSQATRAVKRFGFTHIVASISAAGHGPLARDLLEAAEAWKLELIAQTGNICLFRIL